MSDSGSDRRDRWVRFVPACYSAALSLLIAGPLLGSGYLLLRDAVSTPRSYPTDSALGLGDAAPRAVPQDALLAALSPIVDGGLIVKAILLVALWAAGYGAAVLARELLRVSIGPQLVATTIALWNPYVAERLLQGHWSLLTGYAALPWTVLAAYRIRASAAARRESASTRSSSGRVHTRRGGAVVAPGTEVRATEDAKGNARSVHRYRRLRGISSAPRINPAQHPGAAWAGLAGCFAAAGLTPTGALLAGATALVLVGYRNTLGTLALLVAASAPWLSATALSGAGAEPSDPAGIAAFAARAEPGLGTIGSLAGLGGIWNADAVPDSRTTLLAIIGTVLLLTVVATGIHAVSTGSSKVADLSGVDLGDTNATDRTDATVGDTKTDCSVIAGENVDRAGLRVRRALLLLAATAVVLPALGATPWGREVLEWLVTQVPGAGLLRDTQKYVALAMPAYALCAAAGCHSLATRFRTSPSYVQPQQDRVDVQPEEDTASSTSTSAASSPEPAGSGIGTSGVIAAAVTASSTTSVEGAASAAESGGAASGVMTSDVTASSTTAVEGAASAAESAAAASGLIASGETTSSAATSEATTSNRTTPDATASGAATSGATASGVIASGAADSEVTASGGTAPPASDAASTGKSTEDAVAPVASSGRAAMVPLVAAVFIALLVLPLFDLAWGVGGAIRPVHYPVGWQHVAERIDGPGDVAVLPGGMFRKFPYSGKAPVLDPAPRMLPRDVLQTGELPVRGRSVAGEGARARAVENILLQGGSAHQLAGLGVGWVLVEQTTPGPLGESRTTLAELEPAYADRSLALYRVPDTTTSDETRHSHRLIAYAAHSLWAFLLFGGLLLAAARRPIPRND